MKVAGFGFRSAATTADLQAALEATGHRPDALASIAAKVKTAALRHLANALDLPLITLEEHEVNGAATLTCSPRIKARFGTGSLAEAAALVAARRGQPGASARLLGPRYKSPDGLATVAIAERITP